MRAAALHSAPRGCAGRRRRMPRADGAFVDSSHAGPSNGTADRARTASQEQAAVTTSSSTAARRPSIYVLGFTALGVLGDRQRSRARGAEFLAARGPSSPAVTVPAGRFRPYSPVPGGYVASLDGLGADSLGEHAVERRCGVDDCQHDRVGLSFGGKLPQTLARWPTSATAAGNGRTRGSTARRASRSPSTSRRPAHDAPA